MISNIDAIPWQEVIAPTSDMTEFAAAEGYDRIHLQTSTKPDRKFQMNDRKRIYLRTSCNVYLKKCWKKIQNVDDWDSGWCPCICTGTTNPSKMPIPVSARWLMLIKPSPSISTIWQMPFDFQADTSGRKYIGGKSEILYDLGLRNAMPEFQTGAHIKENIVYNGWSVLQCWCGVVDIFIRIRGQTCS